MKFIKVQCKKCHTVFTRPTGRFNEAVKFGWNQFCSPKCQNTFKTKIKLLICENCNAKITRTPHAISPHNYCSSRCAIIVNNQRYPRKRLLPILKICIVCKRNYKKSSGNKKYCSFDCRIEAERYKPDELLQIIKNGVKRFGRIPGRRDFLEGVNNACIRYFGSWNKAMLAAGFTPNRSHDNRMYKRIISKAEDGHLCNSVSEVLIDNWLFRHNVPHEREVKYPTTNHKADWKINNNGELVFIEYFGLAKDSPRYDRFIKRKIKLCKEQNIGLIKIYPTDLYPKNLMEDNLNNKFAKILN